MRRSVFLLCLSLVLLLAAVSVFSNSRTDDPLGIAVAPQTLILNYDQGGFVSVHTDIPYGTVNTASLVLNDVAVRSTKADATGCLVAYFDEAAVEATVTPPSAIMMFTGTLKSGVVFTGSDAVQVIYRNK